MEQFIESLHLERMYEHVSPVDWCIIGAYVLFALALAIYHSRTATQGLANYFVSGRRMTWWLLGTSMVATTFAADTPLAVSGWVVSRGVSMNWWWWGMAMAHLAGVFFFSRLWRRSEVLTDTELSELRYDGRSAAFLRGFRGLYFAILYNCIVIGWVNLAMVKLIEHTLGIEKFSALIICFTFSLIYTMLAGLTGVMVTDMIQFVLAMFGSIYLAIVAVGHIGGMDTVMAKISENYGAEKAAEITAIFPAPGTEVFLTVCVFVFFQWWTATNIDCGGYLAQRMLSARDERHSFFGLLWFNIAHYCLRPWPWIVVGLCAAAIYGPVGSAGGLEDPEAGYVKMMLEFLPVGVLGVMLASFFGAYMSTIDTHLNWGASYMVNDIYKRFFEKNRGNPLYNAVSWLLFAAFLAGGYMLYNGARHSETGSPKVVLFFIAAFSLLFFIYKIFVRPRTDERHYIHVSLLATVFIALCGAGGTMMMKSISGAWFIITAVYAGLAVIYILRWYWWEINAWSEIGAMFGALFGTVLFRYYMGTIAFPDFRFAPLGGIALFDFPFVLLLIVPCSLAVSFFATAVTKPVDTEHLVRFYKKVRPGGPGWKPIQAQIPGAEKDPGPGGKFVAYIVSVVAVYCTLFGIGKLIMGPRGLGAALLGIAVVLSVVLWKMLTNMKWSQEETQEPGN